MKTVRFTASIVGNAKISVFRSTGRGLIYPVAERVVQTEDSAVSVCVDVPMVGLMDGGYFWFDAESLDGPVTVTDAAWAVPRSARTAEHDTSMSIAITTFNRAAYCINQLRAIAGSSALRKRLDTVYCTDQGSDLVCEQEGFTEISADLGQQLTYIQQANLGGSGGFSRGMYETVKAGDSDFVLLLDDDAVSEPESILRSIQFSDYTIRPVLVGGGMFHLDNRTMLYTQGERINPQRMWMYPSKSMGYNHDFSVEPLRDSPDRHQRIDEDFNGWWMCLIPVAVMRKIGLSLPVFIKFDDIEYGLRAGKAGFPTVCLPGVAVWHQAWHDKDPARSWEEYFTERNRWIAALLTYPDTPPRMLLETLYGDASLGLRFVYSAMALHHMALKDIMRGPQYLVDCLPTKLGEVRELRAQYPDAQVEDSFEAFPEPVGEVESPKNHPSTMKSRYKAAVGLIAASFVRNVDPDKAMRPDAAISARDAAWTWLAFDHVNSALVTTADGNGVAWLKRDNKRFRQGMLEGYRLTRRILRNWRRLSAQYRAYGISSMETWARIFEG